MNKNGFTLIELLASIVILAIITLFAFPAILNLIGGSQSKIDSSMKDYAIAAAREYVNDNVNDFPRTDTDDNFIPIDNVNITVLISSGYINEDVINDNKNSSMKNDRIKVSGNKDRYNYEYIEVSD